MAGEFELKQSKLRPFPLRWLSLYCWLRDSGRGIRCAAVISFRFACLGIDVGNR